jgi:excisionase family DNA binding protein
VKDPTGWITTREAADAIGINAETVSRWAATGKIPSERWGRWYLVPETLPEQLRAAGYEGAEGAEGREWWKRHYGGSTLTFLQPIAGMQHEDDE